jgi:hypothetical protein
MLIQRAVEIVIQAALHASDRLITAPSVAPSRVYILTRVRTEGLVCILAHLGLKT